MLDALEPHQFAEWVAYYDGLGETDDQQNAATMTAAIVNELRELRGLIGARYGVKKPPKPTKATDYLRRWREDESEEKKPKRAMTTDQLYKLFQQRG